MYQTNSIIQMYQNKSSIQMYQNKSFIQMYQNKSIIQMYQTKSCRPVTKQTLYAIYMELRQCFCVLVCHSTVSFVGFFPLDYGLTYDFISLKYHIGVYKKNDNNNNSTPVLPQEKNLN